MRELDGRREEAGGYVQGDAALSVDGQGSTGRGLVGSIIIKGKKGVGGGVRRAEVLEQVCSE